MKITNNGRTLVAEDGYVLKCTCHGIVLGTEVHLDKIMKDGSLHQDSMYNYIEVEISDFIWKI